MTSPVNVSGPPAPQPGDPGHRPGAQPAVVPHPALLTCLLAAIGVAPATAQTDRTDSLAGEKAAERARREELPRNFNLSAGPVALQLSAGLTTEYNDNVRYSEVNRQDDIILRPEFRVRALWPVTELNALEFNVGIGYAQYCLNDELNSNTPLINPGSELAFLLFVGDVRFRLYDRFSYQESLSVRDQGDFINLNNVNRYTRFQNNAGLTADWDLHDLIVRAGFDHENYVPTQERYEDQVRATEKFTLAGELQASEQLRYGIETRTSWNDFETTRYSDFWQFSPGPFADLTLSPHLGFRAGAGYDGVWLETNPGGSTDFSNYYAYLRARHRVNQYLSYSLDVSHGYNVSYSASFRELTSVRLSSQWTLLRNVNLASYFTVGWSEDAAVGTRSPEDYAYLGAGMTAAWQFARRWEASLGYFFTNADSNREFRSYFLNQVRLGVNFRF